MSAPVSPPTAGLRPSARRVLNALLKPYRASEDVDGWVCSSGTLHHQKVGGYGAHSRLSELRRDGWHIEKAQCHCDQRCRYRRVQARRRGEQPPPMWRYRIDAGQARDAIDREGSDG